jgi:hypothetical protein
MNKLRFLCVASLLLCMMLASCKREAGPPARIQVLDNPWLKAPARPILMAEHLNNPMSPRLVGERLVFAESGAGNVSVVENGKTSPLIKGFAREEYDGFQISAQGITVDEASGLWIVAAAEGPGRILLFNPSTFPTDAGRGRVITLEGAVDDNPFATVLAAGGRILVVSGGTKTAYQGAFDPAGNSGPVKPVFQVKTGLIGVAVDPKSGDVFGAVFGNAPGSAEVVRWDATKEPVTLKTVATGLTYAIDLAFTRDGTLLVTEFGSYGGKAQGRVSIVATDGSGSVTPFITGLNNPSGIYVSPENNLYLTEFGETANAQGGTLISLKLVPASQR